MKKRKHSFREVSNPPGLLAQLSIQILVGIGIIIPFYDTITELRFVALGGFLIAIYGIIKLVVNSEAILFHYFPTKHKREKKPKKGDKRIENASGFVFLIGIIFLIFRIVPLDNTIGGLQLFFYSAGLGFLLGIGIVLIIKLLRPSVFYDSSRRLGVILSFGLGFGMFFAASASFINEKKADTDLLTKEVEIVTKSSNTRKSPAYYIFVKIDGDEERIELNKKVWDSFRDGDMVTLELKKGYFNYPFITYLKKIKSGQC